MVPLSLEHSEPLIGIIAEDEGLYKILKNDMGG